MIQEIRIIVDDALVETVIEKVKRIDAVNEEVGIRAFVWDILKIKFPILPLLPQHML